MKVSIIGTGWLGEQMADFLLKRNFSVLGTTTSADKAKRLRAKDVRAVSLNLKSTEINQQVISEVAQSEWIVFTVPPSSLGNTYATECIRFFEQIEKHSFNGTLIYTSSTSVYGNEERIVDETSEHAPQSENAKQIVKVENFIRNHVDQFSIWRMGGLVGPNRHPVNYLAGRSDISKPQAPVNLVHSEDVIRVLQQFVEGTWKYPLLNLCSPDHPNKKEYYTQVAENLNKSLPKFDEQDNSRDKVVKSKYLTEVIFSYNYPSPYDYPQTKKE